MATTFFLKPGETRTSHGPIPHPLIHWYWSLFLNSSIQWLNTAPCPLQHKHTPLQWWRHFIILLGLKKWKVCLPFWPENWEGWKVFFFLFFFLNPDAEELQYYSCVWILGMQSLRIGLILVLEGVVFHYIWLKYLFGTVTIYPDNLFWTFLFKNTKLSIKKKKKKKGQPLFSNVLGRSQNGKQTSFF